MLKSRAIRYFSAERRKFMAVGAVMTGINAGLLALAVSILGVSPVIANSIRVPVTTQIHFGLLKRFIWKNPGGSLWHHQWCRHHLLKAGSTVANQVIFWGLITVGFHYFLAYALSIVLVGNMNFRISQRFVFARKRKKCPA